MRCPLFVSEQMFNRPNLTVEVLYLTAVLAGRARLASTLWLAARSVMGGERRELDQVDLIGFEESTSGRCFKTSNYICKAHKCVSVHIRNFRILQSKCVITIGC